MPKEWEAVDNCYTCHKKIYFINGKWEHATQLTVGAKKHLTPYLRRYQSNHPAVPRQEGESIGMLKKDNRLE